MAKPSPKPKPATSPKVKRDPRATAIHRVLKKHGIGMEFQDLLKASVLQGLKKFDPKVVDQYRDLLKADDRFEFINGADADEVVTLKEWAEVAKGDEPPAEEVEEFKENPMLDKLLAVLPDNAAEIKLVDALRDIFNLRMSKTAPMTLTDAIQRDGRMEVVTVGVDQVIRRRVKTLGEMVAEKEASGDPAKPTSLAAPISNDIGNAKTGDRVVDEKHGEGTVTDHTDLTLTVAFDKDNEPSRTFNIAQARQFMRLAVDPTAVKPIGEVSEVGRTITEEERQANFHKALVQHAEAGKEIARMHAAEKATEAEQSEVLKATRKRIEDLEARAMKHAAAMPTLEMACQREIAFDVEGDGKTSTAPAPVVGEGFHPLPVDQVRGLAQVGLTLDKLHQHLVETFDPGKKSKNVGKLAVEVAGAVYMVRDHSPDKTRWFLQPLVDLDTWEELYQEAHGKPVANWDEHAEGRENRTAGGADCGRTVKIGRKTLVLAPESAGLVIVATKEAVDAYLGRTKAAEPDARSKAAGDTPEPDESSEDDEGAEE